MLEVRRETHKRWLMSSSMQWRDGIIMATPDQPPIFCDGSGNWKSLGMPWSESPDPDPEWIKVVQHEAAGILAPIRRDWMEFVGRCD